MVPGEFVNVQMPEGVYIGRLVSDDGDTVTVEFDADVVIHGIEKETVTKWRI